jgi:hypothetical protein
MSESITVDQLARDIRQIYASDDLQAEASIGRYLQTRLGFLPAPERVDRLERLADQFGTPKPLPTGGAVANEELLTRLFSLVLGGKFTKADLPSADLAQRLAESLNTIFDALNKLVAVIDSTLMGKDRGEETIRQVIGFHLEGQDQTESLQTYLGQISKAFLLAQQAFKKAAHQIVGEILKEIDPEKISREAGGGLRFGPLRKAELYDIYEQKFKKCRQWYETGRFLEDLQRAFEKHCQSKMAW